jgi:hypothetical protein
VDGGEVRGQGGAQPGRRRQCHQETFGDQFTYDNDNDNGNLAIARSVLKEFRQLTPDAIWERLVQPRERRD